MHSYSQALRDCVLRGLARGDGAAADSLERPQLRLWSLAKDVRADAETDCPSWPLPPIASVNSCQILPDDNQRSSRSA